MEKNLDIPDITATDLEDDTIGPIIIKEYRNQVTKRTKDNKYMRIIAIYVNSVFHDFKIFLRTEVYLVEDDIRLVLDEYNSNFITYDLQPVTYTFKNLSESVFNILEPGNPGPGNVIDIEFDDLTMKSNLVVRNVIFAIRFDKKSFSSAVLGFNQNWDYKHYNGYLSQKFLNLTSTSKIHLKCDVIDGSVVNGIREPILFSFVLVEPTGCKVFCEPETIQKKNLKNLL